jgi:hypothetical protein
MKFLTFGIFPVVLMFAACESMNRPLSGDGSFDPLRIPGSGIKSEPTDTGSEFSPGQFVAASIPNTAFFNKRPKGSEDADKLLAVGTNMKIISSDASYVKIELDSGEVGWVPSVMVSIASAPIDGAYQVYPPMPTGSESTLPLLDPNGAPPSDALPTIIDPTAVAPAVIEPAGEATPAVTNASVIESSNSIVPSPALQQAGEKAREQLQKLNPPSQ